MKIQRKDVGYFIAGILALSIFILLHEFQGAKESIYEGSHGVYDHADLH